MVIYSSIKVLQGTYETKNEYGEMTIFNFNSGKYYGLDKVGSFLWGEIKQGPLDVQELVDAVILKFEGDRATIINDINFLVEQLEKEGLVELM
jgi:hypothetical protein